MRNTTVNSQFHEGIEIFNKASVDGDHCQVIIIKATASFRIIAKAYVIVYRQKDRQ